MRDDPVRVIARERSPFAGRLDRRIHLVDGAIAVGEEAQAAGVDE